MRIFIQTNPGEGLPGLGASAQGPVIGGHYLVRIENRSMQISELAAAPDIAEVGTQCSAATVDGVALATGLSFENVLSASGVAFGSFSGLTDAQGSDIGDELPRLTPTACIGRHRGSGDALGDDLKKRFIGIAAAECARSQVGTACPTHTIRSVAGGALASEQARSFHSIVGAVERISTGRAVLRVKGHCD